MHLPPQFGGPNGARSEQTSVSVHNSRLMGERQRMLGRRRTLKAPRAYAKRSERISFPGACERADAELSGRPMDGLPFPSGRTSYLGSV